MLLTRAKVCDCYWETLCDVCPKWNDLWKKKKQQNSSNKLWLMVEMYARVIKIASDRFIIDINECDLDPCGVNSTCFNTVGSYNCSCLKGFAPTNSSLPISTTNPCKGMPFFNLCICFSLFPVSWLNEYLLPNVYSYLFSWWILHPQMFSCNDLILWTQM